MAYVIVKLGKRERNALRTIVESFKDGLAGADNEYQSAYHKDLERCEAVIEKLEKLKGINYGTPGI